MILIMKTAPLFFLSYSVPFPSGHPFYQFFVKSSRTILHITSKCFFPFLIQMLAYHTHLSKLFPFFIFQLNSVKHVGLCCTQKSQVHERKKKSESHSVVSDPLQPHGLYSPWNSPGQNTGVGSLSLLQGIFPTQGSKPGLLHCRQILYQLNHKGSP